MRPLQRDALGETTFVKKRNTIAHTICSSQELSLNVYSCFVINICFIIWSAVYVYIFMLCQSIHFALDFDSKYIEYIYFINERLGVQWYVFTISTIKKQHVQIQGYIYIYTHTGNHIWSFSGFVLFLARSQIVKVTGWNSVESWFWHWITQSAWCFTMTKHVFPKSRYFLVYFQSTYHC